MKTYEQLRRKANDRGRPIKAYVTETFYFAFDYTTLIIKRRIERFSFDYTTLIVKKKFSFSFLRFGHVSLNSSAIINVL